MLQFLHFDQLFPNVLPIMLEIILTNLVDNTKYETKKRVILTFWYSLSLKLFDKSENSATEDGWMTLHALDQCGTVRLMFLPPAKLVYVAATTYLGSSCFNACWTPTSSSRHQWLGLRSCTFIGSQSTEWTGRSRVVSWNLWWCIQVLHMLFNELLFPSGIWGEFVGYCISIWIILAMNSCL